MCFAQTVLDWLSQENTGLLSQRYIDVYNCQLRLGRKDRGGRTCRGLQRFQWERKEMAALVNEGQAVGNGGGAIEAQEGQAELVQQPLQHIQH